MNQGERSMNCAQCGAGLSEGATTCPSCGAAVVRPAATPAPGPASLDQLLAETKRAAKDLASSTAQLSKRLLTKAETAAKDPAAAAKKVARRAAKELEAAAREVDRILKDL
jgi:uncharacterized Zn finger protein (UPF0148 family)